MAMVKRGLGRGFDSLIPTEVVEKEFDVTAEADENAVRMIVPALIDPNPHQPRKDFDEAGLQALAASIRVHGILQPMVASKVGSRYELIAGERRLRAAKIAGLDRVPVIVRSFDEQEKLELALIENIQRQELNPIELATAYAKLRDEFSLSIADISEKVGLARPTISNAIRLLNLPLEVKRAIADGKISGSMGEAILMVEDEHKRLFMLKMAIKHGWTVRQAEEYAQGFRGEGGSKMKAQARLARSSQLTMNLGDYLGTKVTQMATGKGGRLIIEYYSDEELDRIYRAIRHED
jgi:ParB family chromosome partitioning protein